MPEWMQVPPQDSGPAERDRDRRRTTLWAVVIGVVLFLFCAGVGTVVALQLPAVRERIARVFSEAAAQGSTSTRDRRGSDRTEFGYTVPKNRGARYEVDGAVDLLPADRLLTDSRYDAYGIPLSVADEVELIQLLLAGEYDRLDALLDGLQRAGEADARKETWAHYALEVFGVRDEAYRPRLDEWVEWRPDSPFAYAARGLYLVQQGFAARTSKLAKDVTEDEWAAMQAHFDAARGDFAQAEALNPRVLSIYTGRLDVAMAASTRFGDPQTHFEAGLAVAPESWVLRAAYMKSLRPWWTGSWEAMHAVATDAQVLADEDPRMRTLLGLVPHYQASRAGDWAQRAELNTRALSYGDVAAFYAGRGYAYWGMGEYEDGLADFDRAVALRPDALLYRVESAKLRAMVGDFDGASADIEYLTARYPDSERVKTAAKHVADLRRYERWERKQARLKKKNRLRDFFYGK